MGLWLKQGVAVTVKIGPFIDDGDGKTAEIGLTLTQADIRISKNGANIIQKNEATNATTDELGYYDCPIDDTDTNTLGRLQLMVHEAGALPVYHEYMVVTANVWDTLCSTDLFQTDLTQIGGVAQSATDLKDFADAGYDPATDKVTGVKLCDRTTLVDLATACTTVTTTTTATNVTNDVGITQAGADKVWGTAARALTDKAGFSLAADQSAVTIGTVNTIAAGGIDGIWDEVIEGALTGRHVMKLNLAALAGKSAGGGTATITFRDNADGKDRITATVDADGNRSAVVLDGA